MYRNLRSFKDYLFCFTIVLICSSSLPLAQEQILSGGTLWTPGQAPFVGNLWIRDGKIVQIGTFEVPPHLPVLNVSGKQILPGWIDANFIEGRVSDEGSSEVVPHLRVIDGIDRYSSVFQQALEHGVTTVAISSTEAPVIGSQTCIVKTAPQEPAVKISADIKITLGPSPNSRDPWGNFSSFYTRRPRSRLGLYSVIHEAMRSAEVPNSPLAILTSVKSGTLPLRIYAHLKRDIRSALELSRDWNVPLLLEGGTECYFYFPEMKTQQCALLYAPILNPPTFRFETDWGEEQQTPHLHLPQLVVQAGIPLAITSSEELSLAEAAKICFRYGLSEAEVLKAITLQPATLLGIADLVGSLEPGKSADILIFNGHPFQFTGTLETVFIQGTLVYQKK